MPIPCAVLMCHAPIVVPEISGSKAPACARTTQAMSAAAKRLLAHEPHGIAIISPHAPREPRLFGVCGGALLAGDFGRFGAPEVKLHLPGAPRLAEALQRAAPAHGVTTFHLNGREL